MSNESVNELGRALDQAQHVLTGVTSAQWNSSTPCAKWSVRELSNHMVGGMMMFGVITRGQSLPETSDVPELGIDDIASSFDAARQSMLAAWQEPGVFERQIAFPFATLPADAGVKVQLMEVVGHTWDLAHATGQLDRLDDALAESVMGFAGFFISDSVRNASGDPFGLAVDAPDSVAPYARLAGFLGRHQ